MSNNRFIDGPEMWPTKGEAPKATSSTQQQQQTTNEGQQGSDDGDMTHYVDALETWSRMKQNGETNESMSNFLRTTWPKMRTEKLEKEKEGNDEKKEEKEERTKEPTESSSPSPPKQGEEEKKKKGERKNVEVDVIATGSPQYEKRQGEFGGIPSRNKLNTETQKEMGENDIKNMFLRGIAHEKDYFLSYYRHRKNEYEGGDPLPRDDDDQAFKPKSHVDFFAVYDEINKEDDNSDSGEGAKCDDKKPSTVGARHGGSSGRRGQGFHGRTLSSPYLMSMGKGGGSRGHHSLHGKVLKISDPIESSERCWARHDTCPIRDRRHSISDRMDHEEKCSKMPPLDEGRRRMHDDEEDEEEEEELRRAIRERFHDIEGREDHHHHHHPHHNLDPVTVNWATEHPQPEVGIKLRKLINNVALGPSFYRWLKDHSNEGPADIKISYSNLADTVYASLKKRANKSRKYNLAKEVSAIVEWALDIAYIVGDRKNSGNKRVSERLRRDPNRVILALERSLTSWGNLGEFEVPPPLAGIGDDNSGNGGRSSNGIFKRAELAMNRKTLSSAIVEDVAEEARENGYDIRYYWRPISIEAKKMVDYMMSNKELDRLMDFVSWFTISLIRLEYQDQESTTVVFSPQGALGVARVLYHWLNDPKGQSASHSDFPDTGYAYRAIAAVPANTTGDAAMSMLNVSATTMAGKRVTGDGGGNDTSKTRGPKPTPVLDDDDNESESGSDSEEGTEGHKRQQQQRGEEEKEEDHTAWLTEKVNPELYIDTVYEYTKNKPKAVVSIPKNIVKRTELIYLIKKAVSDIVKYEPPSDPKIGGSSNFREWKTGNFFMLVVGKKDTAPIKNMVAGRRRKGDFTKTELDDLDEMMGRLVQRSLFTKNIKKHEVMDLKMNRVKWDPKDRRHFKTDTANLARVIDRDLFDKERVLVRFPPSKVPVNLVLFIEK